MFENIGVLNRIVCGVDRLSLDSQTIRRHSCESNWFCRDPFYLKNAILLGGILGSNSHKILKIQFVPSCSAQFNSI